MENLDNNGDVALDGVPTELSPPPEPSDGLDLDELESETRSILERYGSPEAKSAKRMGPPVTRPWTGASSVVSRGRPFTGLASRRKGQKVKPPTGARPHTDSVAIANSETVRDTISSALTTTTFDSVPRLLVSGKHNGFVDESNQGELKLSRSKSSSFLLEDSPYMSATTAANNRSSTPKKTKSIGAEVKLDDPCSQLKSLSLRDIKYMGFDKPIGAGNNDENAAPPPDKQVCFNCWSAGQGNKCLIHSDTPRSIASNPWENTGNLSMCSNWNIGYLRRKYRSEELEEKFSQTSQSLVFDRTQKEFSTVEQPKHPIYRLVQQHISLLNFTYQRRQNVQIWFQSFIKRLKDGKFRANRSNASAQILLLKSTIKNLIAVNKLSAEVREQHKAPVTETTMPEMPGRKRVLVKKVITVDGNSETRDFVITGPAPLPPKALYQAREYEPPLPVKFVLKEAIENERLDFSNIMSSSIQYATFQRKAAMHNMAVGGLSAEIIVSSQFTGRFPPQYKNFTVVHDVVLLPPRVDEDSPSLPTLDVPPGKLPYVRRDLQTPLDSRLPPTIMVKTGLGPNNRHFFGVNRPEQTGEEEDVGFRTSTWYSPPHIDDSIDTNSFRPSQSVATMNAPVLSPMRTMKVDGATYPFRKETSRTNRVEDLYHLLLTDGACSGNKLQMFTCIGSQQCGYFMQNGRADLPIGRVVTKVVRSWAFLQSETEESAIYDEEMQPLGAGGVVLKTRPRHAKSMPGGDSLMLNSRGDVRAAILRRVAEDDDVLKSNEAPGKVSHKSINSGGRYGGFAVTQTKSHSATSPTSIGPGNRKFAGERASADDGHISAATTEKRTTKSDTASRTSSSTTQSVNQETTAVMSESISQMIGETLNAFSNLGTSPSNPEDLIRLGMGLGASLGAQGFLNAGVGSQPINDESKEEMPDEVHDFQLEEIESCISEESEQGEDYTTTENDQLDSNIVNYSDFNDTPNGLLETLASTRVGRKQVKYLCYTFELNLPVTSIIEPLKPRSMSEEWKENDYDPWSYGRSPTSSTLIRSLAQETKRWPKPKHLEGPDFNNTAQEFASLCRLCRHGKYRELEEMINNPSWTLPIDFCDDAGNTLLMIACQNGNKRIGKKSFYSRASSAACAASEGPCRNRDVSHILPTIAKLCLRRGSRIDAQNLNGNSALHFAFGYGFDELGEYLIQKGANDGLVNAAGFTAYEGIELGTD